MVFILLQVDDICPHRLTSEPSKRSIANLRSFKREFTENDLVSIVNKNGRFWTGSFKSNLPIVQNKRKAGGYAATIEASGGEKMESGTVQIKTNTDKINTMVETDNWSVAKYLWGDVRPISNQANTIIRNSLTKKN